MTPIIALSFRKWYLPDVIIWMENHVFPQKANDIPKGSRRNLMLDKRHVLGSSVTKRDLRGPDYGLATVLWAWIYAYPWLSRVEYTGGTDGRWPKGCPPLTRTEGGWMARDRKELAKYGIPDPPRPRSMFQPTNVTF